MKLSQLVSSALEDAQAKIASAEDAEKVSGLASTLGESALTRNIVKGRGANAMSTKMLNAAEAVGKHLGGKELESQVGRGLMAAGGTLVAAPLVAGAGVMGAKKLMGGKKSEPETKSAGLATRFGDKVIEAAENRGLGGEGTRSFKALESLTRLGNRLGGKGDPASALGRGVLAATGLAAGTTAAGAYGVKKLMDHKNKKEEASQPEKTSALDTAVEAMKLAESLEHLAMLFPKLAEESTQINDINGPEVLVSPNMGTTKDSPTKATSIPAQRASSGGGSGPNMAIETNKHPDAGDQNYAAKAAHAILEAKVAQSNALLMAGHAQAATQLAKQAQVEFLQAKRAYEEEDASTNTPKGNPQSLAVNRNPGDLPVPSGPVTDNAGMISMTKRQAKTEDVRREAGKHVQETALSAASDKGLVDNLDHTEGAKIANIFNKVAHRKVAMAVRP